MCHFCNEHDLEEAKAQVQMHGYEFLQPNAPVQYGVAWDGRVVAHTERKDRAIQMAAEQTASQPGRWEPKVRKVGAWEDLPAEAKK